MQHYKFIIPSPITYVTEAYGILIKYGWECEWIED